MKEYAFFPPCKITNNLRIFLISRVVFIRGMDVKKTVPQS